MQGVLNNRDSDIAHRKARIHKRLARHVARTCQARRRLCKVRSRVWCLSHGMIRVMQVTLYLAALQWCVC